ncbi:thioredoxin family protein [Listeria grandensis]|uniref:thioredoxin family protein n=1 Tax=Listeria grandensis TaxID=1494963 RepID=UPI00164DF4F4|nr:thioredoxin family protein [Listeria grandensis]MBC6314299.1 thioredoxin family protein [Listeria grandensis]
MKKYKIILLTIVTLALFIVGVQLIVDTHAKNLADTKAEANQQVMRHITNTQMKSILAEKKTGYVYIGRPTCPDCEPFRKKLVGALKETERQAFYYNTDKAREADKNYTAIIKEMGVRVVPTLIYYTRGLETDRYKGDLDDQAQITTWLEKQK